MEHPSGDYSLNWECGAYGSPFTKTGNAPISSRAENLEAELLKATSLAF